MRMRAFLSIVSVALALWAGVAQAQDSARILAPSAVPLPEARCAVSLPGWATRSERLIWDKVCANGWADMSDWAGGTCVADSPELTALEPWALSQRFMTLILTNPEFVAARPTTGISLYCTYVPLLDLEERRLPATLRIENSTFKSIDLTDARIDGALDLDRSRVLGDFWAHRMSVNGPLRLYNAKLEARAAFQDVNIAGFTDLRGATVSDRLTFDRAELRRSLFLSDGGTFKSVMLRGARINGAISAIDSTFAGTFDGDNLRTTESVFLRGGSQFDVVNFQSAEIGGNLEADGSTFSERFSAHNAHFAGNVYFRDGTSLQELAMIQAEIDGRLNISRSDVAKTMNFSGMKTGSDVFLRNSTFSSILMLGTEVGGNLETDGSTFSGTFNGDSLSVDESVFLRNDASFQEVVLRRAHIGGALDAGASVFAGAFNADSATIGSNVFFRRGGQFQAVRFRGVEIGGNFETDGSTFAGEFIGDGMSVKGGLYLRDATFADVVLARAHVAGSLDATGSTFNGTLRGNAMRVDSDVVLRNEASFQMVRLNGAQIGGNLEADGSTFHGMLNLSNVSVAQDMYLRTRARFSDVDMIGARIAGHLQMHGAHFDGRVDLSEARMASLVLWRGNRNTSNAQRSNVAWGARGSLILRNAEVGSIQARMRAVAQTGIVDNWHVSDTLRLPVDLNGLTYRRLGGFSSGAENDLARVETDALISWVTHSVPPGMQANDGYRPQPYRALENALSEMGADAAARQVAYARLEHRAETRLSADIRTDFGGWLWQRATQVFDRFLQVTVGFGVYPARAFYWFVGLVVLGTLAARRAERFADASRMDCFWYSLENAIPLIEPSPDHKIIHAEPWVRNFFHFQKVSGFLLASVLIGALTLGG
ncbi:MAG: hypothetical protein AAF822_14830 [Pseudomonadota bacterium]